MWSQRFRRWHRQLSAVLVIQWSVWVLTALGMALVPRQWTTAYRIEPDRKFNAPAAWPALEGLPARLRELGLDQITHLRLSQPGARPVLAAGRDEYDPGDLLTPDASRRLEALTPDQVAAYASKVSGSPISASAVRLIRQHSREYQKHPLPVWRVQAPKAALFFDTVTGQYRDQATAARLFENTMKTIHVLDFSGRAAFSANVMLTAAAILFLLTAAFGILSVRRILVFRRHAVESRSMRLYRWHQALGIGLSVQIVLWVSSGLSVIWLLEPARQSGEQHITHRADPIDWNRVRVHPSLLVNKERDSAKGHPIEVTLAMLLDRPVYRLTWPGRQPYRELWDAERGVLLTLTDQDRNAIAARALKPESYRSIQRWESASALDFYFFEGPFPVWKAYYTEPTFAALAIDQVTGRIPHPPRTRKEIALEIFYNVHVVNWRFGVVQYRLEPALLTVIGLMMCLLGTGVWLQVRRWRKLPPVRAAHTKHQATKEAVRL